MTIEHSVSDAVLTVTPSGRLDSATADEFADYINGVFTMEIQTLMLDFKEVDFISSKGLRVLVTIYKELNGRQLRVVNANPSVIDVFRLSGLLNIFVLQ